MKRLFPILLCLAPCAGMAQPVTAPFTVQDAVKAAVLSNPRLAAARRSIAAAQSGLRSARSPANLEVVVTPGLSESGSDEELLIRQPLELNGVREARAALAAAGVRQTQAAALVELRAVVFETKTAYYELARAQDRMALARELLRAAEEFDRLTGRQVELGSRPGIDRTQTAIEVSRARRQVIEAESRATAALATLNTLMGRPADSALPAPASLTPDAAPAGREAALRQALESRAEIALETEAAESFRQEARLARAEGRPDLAPQFRATRITRGVQESGFGLALTLPLLDYGSRRHRIRQAEESARAQAERIAAARSQVRLEVEQALARLHAANAAIAEYRQGVLEQAQRLLEASRVGFQEGRTSIVAMLEAQRTYRAVQTEYTDTLVESALARAQLEHVTGSVPASMLAGPETRAGRVK